MRKDLRTVYIGPGSITYASTGMHLASAAIVHWNQIFDSARTQLQSQRRVGRQPLARWHLAATSGCRLIPRMRGNDWLAVEHLRRAGTEFRRRAN